MPAGAEIIRSCNHYEREDIDGNGAGGIDIPEWQDSGIGGQLEWDAFAVEPQVDNGLARKDWGDPGKNHGTVDRYDD